MKLAISNVCAAFSSGPVVGTRALPTLLPIIEKAVVSHDQSKDQVAGQYVIALPPGATLHVQSGIGFRTKNDSDYIVRVWRGRAECFLKREHSVTATGVTAIVYTREAYAKDPDVSAEELESIGDCTHVVVAVLASAGPEHCPAAPWTFVHNLAGGNNGELAMNANQIRSKAETIEFYYSVWCVVAD